MEPPDQETAGENTDSYTPGNERYAKSYPELCSEFLTTLAKAIKNTALYTLSHPVVLESLRKNRALLGMLFDAKKESEIMLSFVNDAWLFNDTAVPAVTQESQNLNAFFKAHRLQGLTFVDGVQSFEIGALCEFLGAQAKNRPAGYIEEFFAGKNVSNIRPETVHYVKEGGYAPQSQAYRGSSEAAQGPRPAAAGPVPEIFPSQQARPAAARPAPDGMPAQRARTAAARPVPEIFPELQTRPPAARPGQEIAPAQQPRAAAARPGPETFPAQQNRPPAARPGQEIAPAQQPRAAAPRPAPEIFPTQQTRPAAARPGPETTPAQQPRATAPRPAPEIFTAQQTRPTAARPGPETTPAQQPRAAAPRPAPEIFTAQQTRPPAARPGPETTPAQQPRTAATRPEPESKPDYRKADLDAIFGPTPITGTAGGTGKAGEGPGGGRAGEGPGGGKAGEGPGGGGAGEGPGGGKAGEGPGGGGTGEGPGDEKARESALSSLSFGGILKGLVESAIKDPKDRVRAYEDAVKIMEQQVAESTKAIEAEKQAALSTRARTEHVLSKVADGKVIVDKDGKILMMNPAAEEIAGTKLSDAVGRHISEQLRPGEHFLTMSKDMDLSGGKIVTGEVEVAGDENMGRTLRRSVAMLVDSDGRVVGELSTLPEITKYKEAQRMQEEFLSRVTHDLQSPLASITSALEMLTDAATTKLDSVESKFLDISIRNSHRLSQMIRGILDFSKLQSGKMDMHIVSAPLASMLTEAVDGLTPWAKTKGINLTLRPAAEDLCVMADPPRIVQVLTNLISNAIKATPAGGSVVVAAAPDPNQDGSVLVGVRDTGHGIPKEELNKLFQKFVQLPSRQSMEGVGLGLAIVSDFLKLHNGKVWVTSEVGKGSTFYFTLPQAEKKCSPYSYSPGEQGGYAKS